MNAQDSCRIGRAVDGHAKRKGTAMVSLLWLLFIVLLVLWLVGFAVNWGAFVWLLLIAAAVVLLVNLVSGSRTGRWY